MKRSFIFSVILFFASCGKSPDWIVLFDGATVKGLRGYKWIPFRGNPG